MDNSDTLKPKEGGRYICVGNNGTDGKGYSTNVMSFSITEMENFVYKNNIFDRGLCMMLILIADIKGNFPKFIGNTYA